ncbi:hypothetical protein GCM10023187_26190 [Nibrella viscosa]|uniref:Calcineurin-like phosphoesterase n=1 Tax=Nibrella viscosa TaxID=1084524 RepID=A0ABP8KGJ3_9BACT
MATLVWKEAHGRSRAGTKRQWQRYQDVLRSENTRPVLSCVGNHDFWCQTETQAGFENGGRWALDKLAMAQRYYNLHRNGWQLIVLDSVQPHKDGSWYTAFLDEEQFTWRQQDLKRTPTTNPILIVSHVSILVTCVFFDGPRLDKDHWRIPASWMHTDARWIFDLFHRHPNVKAALSRHFHLQDRVDGNGVVSGAGRGQPNYHTAAGYAW